MERGTWNMVNRYDTTQEEEVVIRHEGEYYRVPISYLKVDVDSNTKRIREDLENPIRRYKRRGDTFLIEYLISYITIPLHFRNTLIKRLLEIDLGYEPQKANELIEYVESTGGFNLRSRVGFIWRVAGEISTDGKYKPDKRTMGILNPLTGKTIKLPNIYGSGELCWGNIQVERYHTLDSMGKIFFLFMQSQFNKDLVGFSRRSERLKNWALEQEEDVIREPTSELKEIKLYLIQKLKQRNISPNKLYLVIFSNLFDEDFNRLDALIS